MVRTFLAIDLPPEVRSILEHTQRELKKSGADVRWVRASGIHLTLKFLGEIPEGTVPGVVGTATKVCAGIRCFRVQVRGLSAFPNLKRPRVFWAGVCGDLEPLRGLQSSLEKGLEALGFPAENRPFSPHLTLGRVRSSRGLSCLLKALVNVGIETDPFTVGEVRVYQSILSREGPAYQVLGICPFLKA